MLYFALILSLNLTSSDPLSPYRNQPVLSVDVVAPEDLSPSQLRKLIDIHPGFLLNEQDLQTAIKRIYGTGKFQNIRVFAKRLGGAVELTFVLEPRLIIENISIQGLSILDETSIRSRLNVRVGSFLENNSAGHGPYELASLVRGQQAVYKGRADYYRGKPAMENVIFKEVPTSANRVQLLQGGAVDIAQYLQPLEIIQLRSAPNVAVETIPASPWPCSISDQQFC